MKIHNGDQYALPVIVRKGTTALAPEDVTDLKIKVHEETKSYSAGELSYDAQRGYWLYPLTEDDTRKLPSTALVQVGVKVGNEIIYSDVSNVYVAASIIKEEWA